MAEKYEGVKFRCERISEDFQWNTKLHALGEWAHLLSNLGLAPVHKEGAYGNHSYRVFNNTFIITRTGMTPKVKLDPEDFCLVESYSKGTFLYRGRFEPSSESLLHLLIYKSFPHINAIMHGHSQLINDHAVELSIAVTPHSYPYGTAELADSARQLLEEHKSFIILKDHGFVAIGTELKITGNIVLTHYSKLIGLLMK